MDWVDYLENWRWISFSPKMTVPNYEFATGNQNVYFLGHNPHLSSPNSGNHPSPCRTDDDVSINTSN